MKVSFWHNTKLFIFYSSLSIETLVLKLIQLEGSLIEVINFPNMCSNIPASPAYGIYISQLIRYARASSNYSDFLKRHLYLRNRLLDQGYKKTRLIRSLKKFIFRYQDLVEIYSVSTDNGERWIFIKWKCIKIRKSTTISRIFFVNVWRKSVFDIYFRN